jgi:hypothetical protein
MVKLVFAALFLLSRVYTMCSSSIYYMLIEYILYSHRAYTIFSLSLYYTLTHGKKGVILKLFFTTRALRK